MNRYFFALFIFLYASLSGADMADWDCQKNAAEEWACVTETPASKTKKTVNKSPVIIKKIPEKKQVMQKKVAESSKEIKVKVVHDPAPIPALTTPHAVMQTPAIAPPEKDFQDPDGWNCQPNKAAENWDCQLVGVDPDGQVQPMPEADALSFRLLDLAFSRQQERAFNNLLGELPYDPWGRCDGRPINKDNFSPKKHLRDTSMLEITSDFSELVNGEITGFIGNVDMTRADQHLRADMASYDPVSEMMDMQGQVYYSEDGMALFSHSASLRLAANKSVLREVLFVTLNGPIRGSAKVVYRDSDTLSHYKEVNYTSCRPSNQDWVIHAERLKMNEDSGLGSATNAWLEFKGIPFLYTPYINFPIDDRRTSGFLFPSWSSNDENGFDLEIPFYWNIATNFDATFRPRYLSKRGFLLGGEFRYLTEITTGSVGVEYIPHDASRNQARFHGKVTNNTQFTPNLRSDLDLSYVSDDDYFDELGNTLTITDRRHIRSQGNLRYDRQGVSFLARGEYYQTIDKTIAKNLRPYLKLPEVSLNLGQSFEAPFSIDFGMNNDYINFYRSNSVVGHRFKTKPFITLPLIGKGGYITPKISYQFTQYLLNHQAKGTPDTISRGLPITSVDAGLFLERAFKLGSSDLLHTLEPRIFYLYIPENNQSNIPIFDTADNDFTFNSLFREFSYSGFDRVQNANQISVGLSSKIINTNTGMEYLKLGVGEIFYFADRTAFLPGQAIETRQLSTMITELSGRYNQHLSFSSSLQWDPYANDFTRGHFSLQFINRPDQVLNLGYRYRQNELIQSDVSFRWPVYDNWYLVGRWQYSLKFNVTKESFLGLEKESCCWRFRVVGRKYINAISDANEAEIQTGIFVQLELKGLSSFGDKVEEFLYENIPGYEKP
jgi:LPS-assembly protein